MDVVTMAVLEDMIGEAIATVEPSYKGTVASVSDLPSDAEDGDLYVVVSEGNARYVFTGGEWKQIDPPIATNAQIDGLYY